MFFALRTDCSDSREVQMLMEGAVVVELLLVAVPPFPRRLLLMCVCVSRLAGGGFVCVCVDWESIQRLSDPAGRWRVCVCACSLIEQPGRWTCKALCVCVCVCI